MPETTSEIWTAFGESLRRFIRPRVGCDADADDVLQDVFARIHAGMAALEDRARLRSWVFQVTRHAIIDHYRSARNGARDLPADLASAPPENALNDEVASWLRSLMAGLPPPDREALELSELEGQSDKDVAANLGLSLTAAKSRVRRARQRLRALLEECCAIEFDRRGNAISYRRRRDDCGACDCG